MAAIWWNSTELAYSSCVADVIEGGGQGATPAGLWLVLAGTDLVGTWVLIFTSFVDCSGSVCLPSFSFSDTAWG